MTDADSPGWERNFRNAVAVKREELGMSQSALARALSGMGIPFRQQMVQRVESGERPIRLNEAVGMSRILGIPISDGIEGYSGADQEKMLRWKIDTRLRDAMSIIVSITQVSHRIRVVGDDLYELDQSMDGAMLSAEAGEVYEDLKVLFRIMTMLIRATGTAETEGLDELKPLLKKYGLWDRNGEHSDDA